MSCVAGPAPCCRSRSGWCWSGFSATFWPESRPTPNARASEPMPRASIAIDLPVSCDTAFAVIHDYTRRLDWDTMLRSARLLGGATQVGLGVRTVCGGTWRGAFLALETE